MPPNQQNVLIRFASPILQVIAFSTLFSLSTCQSDQILPIEQNDSYVVSKDKVAYAPLEIIRFQVDNELPQNTIIRYKYLEEVIEEVSYQGKTWEWQAPIENHRGYMVELLTINHNMEELLACIAVDVSTDWSSFPRYGFLSDFSTNANTNATIDLLSRHHINALLFHGWCSDPYKPYPDISGHTGQTWQNMTGQEVSLYKLKEYIALAKNRHIRTFYQNMAFGAPAGGQTHDIPERWHLFRDPIRQQKDIYQTRKPPYHYDMYVMNLASLGWQQHVSETNHHIINLFGFDGWHMDQFGDRGQVYDYGGQIVPLASDFKPFLDFLKGDNPTTRLIFNARNQFGQYAIAHSPVDVLFTEVQPPNDSYGDLGRIILNNHSFSNNLKQTVLAAYMNKGLSKEPGYFNTHSVLLTNAVIFALGASHLELGEHMLSSEVYYNDNLQMSNKLQTALVSYYDFLVAYQNILRDGGTFNRPAIVVANRACCVNHWPPQPGNIVLIGKEIDNRQVVHLINFLDIESLDWQDPMGLKPEPENLQNVTIMHSTNKTVKKIWFASPDLNHGSSQMIDFTQDDTNVIFQIPSLTYWSMIVIDY